MTHVLRIIALFALVISVAMPLSARAQVCEAPYEVITTLPPPTFGFPTVWDAKFGDREKMIQLASGVVVEGGTVFALGRSLSKEDFHPEEIVLVELNRRGRALKEERYPAKTAEDPVKLIRLGQGYLALSNMRGGKSNAEKWARVSWYDENGKYKKDITIKDPAFDYEAINIVAAVEGSGFVVVLHGVNRDNESDQNGVIARFDDAGKQLWRRAYRPGIPNMLTNLVAIDKASYMATGRIRLDDGRVAAWALRLGYDGAIQWQRTYPRGEYAVFNDAASGPMLTVDGKGYILVGDSRPFDGGADAAWIMEISALGEPLWQRYYRRSDFAMSGKWVTHYPDGRIGLFMNAKALEDTDGIGHIRLLTLSPRGATVQDEAYYEGLQARATDFTEGWNGERVLTAIIDDDASLTGNEIEPVVVIGLAANEASAGGGNSEGEKKEPEDPVLKGWVFVATALDPYDDPCVERGGRR